MLIKTILVAWCGWSTQKFEVVNRQTWCCSLWWCKCHTSMKWQTITPYDKIPFMDKMESALRETHRIDMLGEDQRMRIEANNKNLQQGSPPFSLGNGQVEGALPILSMRNIEDLSSMRNSLWLHHGFLSTRIYPFGYCMFKMVSIPQHWTGTSAPLNTGQPRIRKVLSHARHASSKLHYGRNLSECFSHLGYTVRQHRAGRVLDSQYSYDLDLLLRKNRNARRNFKDKKKMPHSHPAQ